MPLAAGWDYFYDLFSLVTVRQGLKSLSDSPSNELDRDRTIAVFEEPGDRIRVPTFAESFNLTVGEMFSWLTQ
ncbi:hypothetical protein QUA27_05520 [Microcoleus sp. Pol14C6]|uniref:hypothetical protein n=1 Tax=Microcoleus sp. Pol14C6 TaxID=3055399 RepID=UPI002FD03E60